MPETPLKLAAQQLVAASLADLTPEGRAQRTAAARAQGPGSLQYWAKRVDPNQVLDETERTRRAQEEKTAYFRRIASGRKKAREADAA
ncbi:hypothetical protein ACSDR0_15285 [Streptosporangium sp. G11]|uniref:hypothetical protein n=1 Tax=Streptosporangium sp. G11 TaxID=3436926 RepID=UPI003EBD3BDD